MLGLNWRNITVNCNFCAKDTHSRLHKRNIQQFQFGAQCGCAPLKQFRSFLTSKTNWYPLGIFQYYILLQALEIQESLAGSATLSPQLHPAPSPQGATAVNKHSRSQPRRLFHSDQIEVVSLTIINHNWHSASEFTSLGFFASSAITIALAPTSTQTMMARDPGRRTSAIVQFMH